MGKEKAAAPAAAEVVDELPRTIVRRVVKEKLSEISGDAGDVNLHKEALIAFSESARIFIHYLSATAHDICTESKRQIINADDVLKALEEIEFSEFIEPLRDGLDEFKKKAAGKRAGAAKAKEISKKRKTDADTAKEKGKAVSEVKNGDNGDEDEEEANGDDVDEGEEQVSGENEEDAEEQGSGDNEEDAEEPGSGDNEEDAEEQASGDDEDEAEEQASGDGEDEAEEPASGDSEDEAEGQGSGDNEDEVEEVASEDDEDSHSS